GDRQVRNRGTLVGSLVFAAPWGDIAPAAVALGAEVAVLGASGSRREPLDHFLQGPGETTLQGDEFVTHLVLPRPPGGSVYLKHGRVAQDRATLGVAVAMSLAADGCIDTVRVVLGGLARHPAIRATALEQALRGTRLDNAILEDAGARAATLDVQSDELASAAYRRQLLRVYVPRALARAAERAQS
ncbi:MAG: xanthine dehydrogenase family protein subunit M, partial [Gammaproteobacteria bacterium]